MFEEIDELLRESTETMVRMNERYIKVLEDKLKIMKERCPESYEAMETEFIKRKKKEEA